MTKVVILLGAGATLSDVATKPRKDRPPLDRGFFSEARLTDQVRVNRVALYMADVYGCDVLAPQFDSLEGVMGQIYTDCFNELTAKPALAAFRELTTLFNVRLARTTNGIAPTNKRLLYRIVAHYLSHGVAPGDMTLITFNQDIQVEKTLHLMSTVDRWRSIANRVFCFPGLYALDDPAPSVTRPKSSAVPIFQPTPGVDGCLRLLKLHGSLNWLSTHSSPTPSRQARFNPARVIRITARQTIDSTMRFSSKYTLPVIVPPVHNKSAVFHEKMGPLWQLSEKALTTADEIVVFGYSCPPADYESSNQLTRSQRSRTTGHPLIHIIDPAPEITARYAALFGARHLRYYASGHDFARALSPTGV